MLDEIVEKTKERVEKSKEIIPLDELKREVSQLEISDDFPFKEALSGEDISIIAEVKKASPSKGLIAEDFDYIEIAKEYEQAGASAISVLTEPYFFKGSNDFLREISENVNIPILRKDFTIDEYMIYEAKSLGASAILLIVSILDIVQLKKYLDLAHDLGLSAIVETHDADEIKIAMDAGAQIIGVNNRNLADFTVDIENSIRLRRLVSDDIIFISESGIKTKEDVGRLKENDVDAVEKGLPCIFRKGGEICMNEKMILELTNAILDSKTGELLGLIDKVCESGKSVGVIIKEINSLLRDALIIKTCEDANKILSYPTDKYNALKSACEKAVSDKILRALEIFTLAENSLKYSNNPRIVFETSALKASKPQSDYDIDALMVRIKTLEEIIEKGDIKVCEAKKEPKIEVERKEETIEKKDVESATSQELKAKVLTFLRKNGSEMLWNVMQSVSIETIGKVVKLTPSNSSDGELIKKVDNVNKIKEALNEYLPFEIEVEEYKREKLLSEVDDATEKIKKIFGDDIVIVKK